MFSSVGWGEILILLAAALIILGPERLPDAVSWVMGAIRKVRDYASGASTQLQDELGTDFDDIRKPLSQLNELRQMSPKSIVTKHIFDGDSSTIDDLGTSVRETLDISRVRPSAPSRRRDASNQVDTSEQAELGRPGPTATPARKHDVTDWDAT